MHLHVNGPAKRAGEEGKALRARIKVDYSKFSDVSESFLREGNGFINAGLCNIQYELWLLQSKRFIHVFISEDEGMCS